MKCHPLMSVRWIRLGLSAAVIASTASLAQAQILFSENFDGLAGSLQQSVNERTGAARVTRRVVDAGTSVPVANAFTHTPPAGWSVNNAYDVYGAQPALGGNSGVPLLGDPNYGVEEWEGWSFARKDFWVFADDQGRSSFTLGSGTVAIADGDEWDDLRKDGSGTDIARQGFMNTELVTGNINVSSYQGQTLQFKFDSSWQAECCDDSNVNPAFSNKNTQGVVIAASFDGAPAVNDTFLANWDSVNSGGFFKPDATNETLTYALNVPAGATNVKLKFGYYNAANDWWWAVDNLELKDVGSNLVWSENFEGLPLGPSVNERANLGHVTKAATEPNTTPVPNAFTHNGPAGWNVDNSGGVPGIGNPTEGVEEWEGWSFTNRDFWLYVKDSNRSQFSKGTGVFAVADPDNWDALGNPEAQGSYNSLLVTPSISLAGVLPGSLKLAFDSSWRPEDTQTAIVEADFGNGFVEVLRWESDAMSPNFHGDNTDESVLLSLNNPAGATSVKFRWGMVNATDDWWWAVDNIVVSAVPEPCVTVLVVMAMFCLTVVGGRRRT